MLQQLAPKYIDTGEAKLIYRNYPIIGPESDTAAQAAECAAIKIDFGLMPITYSPIKLAKIAVPSRLPI